MPAMATTHASTTMYLCLKHHLASPLMLGPLCLSVSNYDGRVPSRSAGILLHRGEGAELEVLLVHPGGPAWAGRDRGAWSIPKGEYGGGEDALAAARREFEEELGSAAPDAEPLEL